MNIETKKISELVENPNNVRKHSAQQIEQLKNSIREFGFTVPLVVNTAGMILAGHGRYIAARALGFEAVPCVIADNLTEQQQRAYALIDNRIGQNSEWDRELLLKELDSLSGCFDFLDFGFSDFELPNLADAPKLSDFISPQGKKDRDLDDATEHRGTKRTTIKISVSKANETEAIVKIQNALAGMEYELK